MSIRGSLFIFITFIVFLYSFKKPKAGLFYFILLLFLRDGYLMEQIPEVYQSWHLPLVTSLVVLVTWFFNNLGKGERIYKPIEIILLFLLGVIIFISKRNAIEPWKTLDIFDEYIRMIVLGFLIINIIKTEKDLKEILFLLIGLITFLVLYAYKQYKLEGYPIAVPNFYYVDRNFFAQSIAAVLPMAYMFFEEAKKKVLKFTFLGIVAIMAMGVILTYSRGGLLALLLGLFFLFWQSRKKVSMVVFGVIILMLFLPHIGEKYVNRVNTIQTYEEDSAAMARVASWHAAINMFNDYPLTGIGAGNFNYRVYDYCPIELRQYAGGELSIHSTFLQILSETGLLGSMLFMLVIFLCVYSTFSLNRKNNKLQLERRVNLAIPNALRASLLAFCGAAVFLPGAYYSYIYILFPLIMASKKIYSDKLKALKA